MKVSARRREWSSLREPGRAPGRESRPGGGPLGAGGLAAAYGLRLEPVDAKIAAGLGLAVGLDFANSINSGGPTNTELILTTTVTRDGQYVARKTDVYYLENVDTPLFMRPSYYRTVNMKVVSQ